MKEASHSKGHSGEGIAFNFQGTSWDVWTGPQGEDQGTREGYEDCEDYCGSIQDGQHLIL